MNRFGSIVFGLCLLLTISACGTVKDVVTSPFVKEQEPLEGERHSILDYQQSLKADSSMADVKVRVPDMESNTRWYKSSGFHVSTAEHSIAPVLIKNVIKVDAGAGADDDERILATPVVAGNKVFTIDRDGEIKAFDVNNLYKVLWHFKTRHKKDVNVRPLNAGMTYYEGRLYVTTGGSRILALNVEDGSILWDRQINSLARSAPSVVNGKVFVNTIGNKLYAIDANEGGILWTHSGMTEDVSVFGTASPVATNNVVFVPYSSGEIYALREDNGREIWSDNLSYNQSQEIYSLNDIVASPVIALNKLITLNNDGLLVASELFTGERAWERQISATHAPWSFGDFLFVVTKDNQLVAIHTQSGAIKWVEQLPRFTNVKKQEGQIVWSGPVAASGRLLVTGNHGVMLSISVETGGILQQYDIPKSVYLPPVVAHDMILLYTNAASLVGLVGEVPVANIVMHKSPR